MGGAQWMKWHTRDWLLSHTRLRLPMAAKALFLDLLFAEFDNDGYLPNDEVLLAKLADCPLEDFRQLWPAIADQFAQGEKGLYNKRLLTEFEGMRNAREAQSEAGKKGREKQLQANLGGGPGQLQATPGQKEKEKEKETETEEEETPSSKLRFAGTALEDPKALDSFQRELFKYYLQLTGKNPAMYDFTEKRERMFQRRLEEILKKTGRDVNRAGILVRLAIDTLSRSDFHMGREERTHGKKYNDWSILFRSWEMFESWVNGSRA